MANEKLNKLRRTNLELKEKVMRMPVVEQVPFRVLHFLTLLLFYAFMSFALFDRSYTTVI